MNWDALGAIGEIAGAAAVLVTLFYLALQVKHATTPDIASPTPYPITIICIPLQIIIPRLAPPRMRKSPAFYYDRFDILVILS